MAVAGRVAGATILQQRLHVFGRVDGQDVFIKCGESDLRGRREMFRLITSRERKAIRALQGLSAPQLLQPSARSLRRLVDRPLASLIVLRRVRAQPLHWLRYPMPGLFGYWAAIAEQFVAFRRRGVLYSDIKVGNILASSRPLAMTIVDYDRVCPASSTLRYPGSLLGKTNEHCAPEHGRLPWLPEASLMYQLGMLWAQSAESDFDNLAKSRPGRLEKLLSRVERRGGAGLARLMRDCLADEPGDRPTGYEDLLRRVYAAELPGEAIRVWAKLREPYAEALAELGLGDSRGVERAPKPGRGRSGRRRRSSR